VSQTRTKVAVIFGGKSNEHSVSCVSAGSVLKHIDSERYDVVPVGITSEGAWVLGAADLDELAITGRVLPSVDKNSTALTLSADPTRAGALVSLDGSDAGTVLASVDVVFPLLHGPYGEDGTLQGLLELAGVPYVGPGVLASAAGMDKEFTKKLLAAEGLPVGRQVVLRRGVDALTAEQQDFLGLPAFVKPARGGSSIGITRITSWDQLSRAVDHARQHDPKVIVEGAIHGREVECGVLEFPDGSVRASVVAEIRMPDAPADDHTFYDFDSKYLDDVCEFDVPAALSANVSEDIRRIAVDAFHALDCQGLARVDLFVTEDGPVINEINTMPGFTPISMYPKLWQVAGLSYADLIDRLIKLGIEQRSDRRDLKTTPD